MGLWDQKKVLDYPELELQAVSCKLPNVGAGNQALGPLEERQAPFTTEPPLQS